jgi:hypothetical protein
VSWGPTAGFANPESGHHRLWRNNHDGTFTNVAEDAGVQSGPTFLPEGWGPGFGDYDLDGDLDLAVPSWTTGGTRLYENNGDSTFSEVTGYAGIYDESVRGFSAKFADMNGDRYPELLIAADFGTSRYYINDGDGTFTDYTADSGTGLDGNGMGHATGDFDNDGRLDWYVTSIFSPNNDSGMPNVPGTGNYLYHSLGNDVYESIAATAGVRDGGWGWGTEAIDIDHDGDLDLAETNGWPGTNGYGEFEWDGEHCYLFRNNGALLFGDIAQTCGFVNTRQGRGLVRLDYDNDGDQDVVVFSNRDDLMLLRNHLEGQPDARWLRILCNTSTDENLAPDGYGTWFTARAGGQEWHRYLDGGSTYMSQSELSVHYGLGTVETLDELVVGWAVGPPTVLTNVPTNRTITVWPGGKPGDLDLNGVVTFRDLLLLIGAWGPCEGDPCAGDLDGSGAVNGADLVLVFQHWD